MMVMVIVVMAMVVIAIVTMLKTEIQVEITQHCLSVLREAILFVLKVTLMCWITPLGSVAATATSFSAPRDRCKHNDCRHFCLFFTAGNVKGDESASDLVISGLLGTKVRPTICLSVFVPFLFSWSPVRFTERSGSNVCSVQGSKQVCVCVCVCAVSYTHLTLPTS